MTAGLTFYGLQSSIGRTVTAFIAGLDCGDYTVATDGTIFVPYGADPDGLLQPAYLVAVSGAIPLGGFGNIAGVLQVTVASVVHNVTVPIVLGFNYTTRVQLVRPQVETDLKLPTGPGLGKVRRIAEVGFLFHATGPISYGTVFTKLHTAQFKSKGGTALLSSQLFTGVFWDTIDDTSSFDGQICWQITRPTQATVVSLSGFIKTAERS